MTDRTLKGITVCGMGKVGVPLMRTLAQWHPTFGFDIVPERREMNLHDCIAQSDTAIVMVQTPSRADGSFIHDHVIDAVKRIQSEVEAQHIENFLYVIGSTVMPGTCDMLTKIVGPNLAYNPLLIRLEHIYEDLVKPPFVLIGANDSKAMTHAMCMWSGLDVPFRCLTLVEAELAKITLNCALTMKISLANQLLLVAERFGAGPCAIMEAVGNDPRIGPEYLEPGRPYEGPCLPRDNRMFEFIARSVGCDAPLSLAADEINAKMKARK